MKLNEYIKYDGLGLAELIRNREVSATEVIDCAGQAIDSVNPQINSIIEQFSAPLSANQSPDAPFQGVPFLIKDLALHAKGVLNEFGSRLAQGIRFNHDTELMKRFRNAGPADSGSYRYTGIRLLRNDRTHNKRSQSQSLGPDTHARRVQRRQFRGRCRRYCAAGPCK